GIEKDPKFIEAAFSTQKGDISSIIELPDNRFFALEVVDKKEPRPQTLAEAKTKLLKDYRKVKATKQAEEIMEAAKERIAKGDSWDEVAKSNKLFRADTISNFKRDGNNNRPSSAIREAAFKLSLAKPDHKEVIKGADSLTLVRLQQITPAKQSEYEKEAVALRSSLKSSLGLELLTAYVDGLWKKANIRINQELFDRM
ncbi:MAG: hypothetical protein HQL69_24440, partial [Magnetococcales bacterium]|nr:hypothetical protein [Magnetococcales bacterium]